MVSPFFSSERDEERLTRESRDGQRSTHLFCFRSFAVVASRNKCLRGRLPYEWRVNGSGATDGDFLEAVNDQRSIIAEQRNPMEIGIPCSCCAATRASRVTVEQVL